MERSFSSCPAVFQSGWRQGGRMSSQVIAVGTTGSISSSVLMGFVM